MINTPSLYAILPGQGGGREEHYEVRYGEMGTQRSSRVGETGNRVIYEISCDGQIRNTDERGSGNYRKQMMFVCLCIARKGIPWTIFRVRS